MKYTQKILVAMITFQFIFSTFPLNYGWNQSVARAEKDQADFKPVVSTLSTEEMFKQYQALAKEFDSSPLDCMKTMNEVKGFVNIATSEDEIRKDNDDFLGEDGKVDSSKKARVINCQHKAIQLASWQLKLDQIANDAQNSKGTCSNCSAEKLDPIAHKFITENAGNAAKNFATQTESADGTFCSSVVKQQVKKEQCDMTCGVVQEFAKQNPSLAFLAKPLSQPHRGFQCAGSNQHVDCIGDMITAFTTSLTEAGKTGITLAGGIINKFTNPRAFNPWHTDSEADKKASMRAIAMAKFNEKQAAIEANANKKQDAEGALQNLGSFMLKLMEYVGNVKMYMDMNERWSCAHCRDKYQTFCASIGILGKDYVISLAVMAAFGGGLGYIAKKFPKFAERFAKRELENVETKEAKNLLSKGVTHAEVSAMGRVKNTTISAWNNFKTMPGTKQLYQFLSYNTKVFGKVFHAVSNADPVVIGIKVGEGTKHNVQKFLGHEAAVAGAITAPGDVNKVAQEIETINSMEMGPHGGSKMSVATSPEGIEESIFKGKNAIIKKSKASPVVEVNDQQVEMVVQMGSKDPSVSGQVKKYKLANSPSAKIDIPSNALKGIETAEKVEVSVSTKKGNNNTAWLEFEGKNGEKVQLPVEKKTLSKGKPEVHVTEEGTYVVKNAEGTKGKDIIFFKDKEGLLHKAEVNPRELNDAMANTIHGKNLEVATRDGIKENLKRQKNVAYREIATQDGTGELEIQTEKDCPGPIHVK